MKRSRNMPLVVSSRNSLQHLILKIIIMLAMCVCFSRHLKGLPTSQLSLSLLADLSSFLLMRMQRIWSWRDKPVGLSLQQISMSLQRRCPKCWCCRMKRCAQCSSNVGKQPNNFRPNVWLLSTSSYMQLSEVPGPFHQSEVSSDAACHFPSSHIPHD